MRIGRRLGKFNMDGHQAFAKAIEELRKSEKKNFDQTVDLIINLKEFDVRREAFNTFITLPVKVKNKKILGFFEKDSKIIDTVKKDEFGRFKEKKDIKKLIKQYDFFIANAKLMPAVATSFGRVLGPVGKMPSPQLGILPSEDDKMVNAMVERINSTVRIRVKEPSIKVPVAKESMKDEDIIKNCISVYHKILESLPRQKDNVRNIKIKLTMNKPVNVEI
jgi:large subunit ribosomal protein L1